MTLRCFLPRFALLWSLAAAATAAALSVSEIADVSPKVDETPVPVKTIAPAYPAALRDAKVGGVVSIVVVIDEKGEVLAAEAAKASNDAFREPALDAVRRWKFKPAKVGGHAVKVKVTIPVRFSID